MPEHDTQPTMVITGGSSGLGAAIVEQAVHAGFSVANIAQTVESCATSRRGVTNIVFDFARESLEKLKAKMEGIPCNVLVNCAGINHIEWLADLDDRDWEKVMDVNVRSIWWMTQTMLPQLASPASGTFRSGNAGTILNIVSNASHMPMTASLAYNASKGAAHIMTLQMARELTPKYGITVFGISPGKMMATGMSDYIDQRVPEVRGWTPEQARQYQTNGLLTGEINPKVLAELIVHLLTYRYRHEHLSGCIIPYGATK